MGIDTDVQVKRIIGVENFNRLRQLGYEVERREELLRLRQADRALEKIAAGVEQARPKATTGGEYTE